MVSLGCLSGHARAADQMEIMESQIRAMQSQLAVMKKEHNEEVKRARAVLAHQREEAENNPYSQRAGYINPNARGGQTSWNVSTPLLAPPRTASTPYGEITGTPPGTLQLVWPFASRSNSGGWHPNYAWRVC